MESNDLSCIKLIQTTFYNTQKCQLDKNSEV